MAESVEMVRPTELGWRSPALKPLSRRRRSEPGTLSVDSMGVLSSAGDDGACTPSGLIKHASIGVHVQEVRTELLC